MYNEIIKSFKNSGIIKQSKSQLISGISTFCENTDAIQKKAKGFIFIEELDESDRKEMDQKYGKVFKRDSL